MKLEFLKEFPFFTKNDIEAYLHKKNPDVIVSKLNKTNKIIKIEKGKYTMHEDPLIYITTLSIPSYLSGFAALNYYGYSNQIQINNSVLTTNQKKSIKNCKYIKVKKDFLFGFEKIRYKKFDLFISNKEKLLIDCIYLQKLGVSIDELTYLIKNINKNLIIEYLKKMDNLSLIKRIGYLLEQEGISIYSEFKNRILNDKNYVILEQKLPKTNNINNKWRINVNISK